MSFKSGSFSFVKFKLDPNLDKEAVYKGLEMIPCRYPSEGEEATIGWGTSETDEVSPIIDNNTFFLFSLVQYVKKVKPAALKQLISMKEREFLENNPEIAKIPREQKNAIKDAAKFELISKTIPERVEYEVIFDFHSKEIFFLRKDNKSIELFEKLFNQTFGFPVDGILVPESEYPEEVVMQAIKSDFLEWLWFNEDESYKASGRAKLVNPEVNESVICTFNEDAAEAKLALRHGKTLVELSFVIEEEDPWSVVLYSDYGVATVKFPRSEADDPNILRKDQLDEADRWIKDKTIRFLSDRFSSEWSSIYQRMIEWRNQ